MRRYRILILSLCGALFCALVLPLRGAVVDDTYIHLQYARNLAERGEFSFNRGDPTYGATSPLWVCVLAAVYRLGGDILVWCQILSWLFAVGSIMLVYRLTATLAGEEYAPAAAALICAGEAWLVRWSAVGMETSFAAFMVLLSFMTALSAARSRRRSAVFGFVLFLAVLSRPEALALVPLSILASAFAPGPTARRYPYLVVFVPLFALWLFLIHRHTGSFFPLTAGAKQGRPVLSPIIFQRALVPAKIMGATVLLPWLALIGGLLHSLFRERSLTSLVVGREHADGAKRAGVLLLIFWVFGLPAAYVLFDFQVLSRYLVPVIPGVIVLGTVSWERLSALVWKGAVTRRIAGALFVLFVMVPSVIFYAKVVVPPTEQFSQGLKTVVVEMAEWLRDNAPPDALVATPDIGAIGYVSERRVLDLGGLVTPQINEMRRSIDVERIIDEGLYLAFKPDYLVDRSEIPGRFSGKVIRGYRFTPLRGGRVPNLGIRQPKPVVYVLYRIEPESKQEE